MRLIQEKHTKGSLTRDKHLLTRFFSDYSRLGRLKFYEFISLCEWKMNCFADGGIKEKREIREERKKNWEIW